MKYGLKVLSLTRRGFVLKLYSDESGLSGELRVTFPTFLGAVAMLPSLRWPKAFVWLFLRHCQIVVGDREIKFGNRAEAIETALVIFDLLNAERRALKQARNWVPPTPTPLHQSEQHVGVIRRLLRKINPNA